MAAWRRLLQSVAFAGRSRPEPGQDGASTSTTRDMANFSVRFFPRCRLRRRGPSGRGIFMDLSELKFRADNCRRVAASLLNPDVIRELKEFAKIGRASCRERGLQ